MNKYLKYGIIFFVVLALFLLVYFVFIKNNDSDAVRFQREYTQVDKDNVFVYRDEDEIIKILKNGTGIVFLGFPECPACQAYVKMLNDVAKSEGIEKIYYYNIKNAREENTEGYKEIVELLGENLLFDEEGNRRVYVPDVTFVLDGNIVLHDNESSVLDKGVTPTEYWTDKRKENLRKKLVEGMKLISDDMCTSCN